MLDDRDDAVAEPLTVDAALRAAGGFGRYQRRVLVSFALMNQLFCLLMMLPVLLLPRLEGPWSLSPAELALVESVFSMGQWASF
eukprot:5529648-Prymnesium_polylepis.1